MAFNDQKKCFESADGTSVLLNLVKRQWKWEYSLKIKLPNPLCVQISKVDANKTCKTEKILHENPCKMGQAATGQGKQAQLNVTRILGWATSFTEISWAFLFQNFPINLSDFYLIAL